MAEVYAWRGKVIDEMDVEAARSELRNAARCIERLHDHAYQDKMDHLRELADRRANLSASAGPAPRFAFLAGCAFGASLGGLLASLGWFAFMAVS